MRQYIYQINTNGTLQDLVITQSNEGQYFVKWEDQDLGYLYLDGVDEHTGEIIWKGSTTTLNLIAPELGRYLEKEDH